MVPTIALLLYVGTIYAVLPRVQTISAIYAVLPRAHTISAAGVRPW
jgi:hypothetical protein